MDDYPSPSPQTRNILGVPVEFAFAMFALLVGVNLVYLDILVFGRLSAPPDGSPSVTAVTPQPLQGVNQTCPQSCIDQMQKLALISPTITKNPSSQTTPSNTIATSPNREFFIPFGAGSGSATEWESIAGLEATINTANYPQVKTVTFEATLRIPTGNQTMSVRLYNVTDKHPVWFSDISLEGGTTKLVISPSVALDVGNKTYQVQLKTSLGYLSYIDQSRLKIVTQ